MILRGRLEDRAFRTSADAIVVGSGAGGAVVARELARAGMSVVVLEEGGDYEPSEYQAMRPTETFRRLAREAGLGLAVGLGDTPVISVLAGKCVGGSSVLTGGVCFRIPDDVLHDWNERLGLGDLTPEKLTPYFDEIERDLSVEVVPEALRSRSTELFVEGAERLGIKMKPLRRNTPKCQGTARCNFGCPNNAKMSVDVAVLPEAIAKGAIVVSDALVEKVVITNGRATGIRGRLIDKRGEPGLPLAVDAKVVVLACGSMHTPVLLKRSGVKNTHVGRHLTLHPAYRIGALFDEQVEGWDGAMQSVYSDHFAEEGITLVGIYGTANVLAAAFPGVGRDHRRIVKSLPNLAFFGAMIHDEGSGTIRRWIGREPLLTYRMAERDRPRIWRGIEILGEMAFAAGAREVLLPIFGAEPVKSLSALKAGLASFPSTKKVECMAFHPLGSARMSTRASDGVVRPTGETWAVNGLYVADGSILPTSIGVNSQVPVMAMALRVARGIAERQGNRVAA